MSFLQSVIQDFTPGAAGIWTGVIMAAAYFVREWRETRKLSHADRLARREGYAKQVEMLTAENRLLLEDQKKLRIEYDEHRKLCQQETDQLREHVVNVERRLSGVLRKIADMAIRVARGDTDANTLAISLTTIAQEAETTQ